MPSVAVLAEPPITPKTIATDLTNCGFNVLGWEEASPQTFQSTLRQTPDLIIAVSAAPTDELLDFAALLKKTAPCALVLFTTDTSPAKINRAAAAGVHSYVVNGYAPQRLRSIAQVALARFHHETLQGERLVDLARDLRERKEIERAKGLLMRSRGLSEQGAFELMRTLAMQRRLRLPRVAEAVIGLSIGAEAVNRAGQLRMLAQRLARCSIQLAFDVHAEWAAANARDCRERIESNIAILRRTVADRGCADDIERIAATWTALRTELDGRPDLEAIDSLAEQLTRDAETLTAFLEHSGLVTNLRVINIAGRQRMLSQRAAKLCLLLALDGNPARAEARAADLQATVAAFTCAHADLGAMPIHNLEIDRWLAEATAAWADMAPFQRAEGAMTRCVETAERLLDTMEALTEAYERAAQILIGDRIETFTPPPPAA